MTCKLITKTIDMGFGEGAFQIMCETHNYPWSPGETVPEGTECPVAESLKLTGEEINAKNEALIAAGKATRGPV